MAHISPALSHASPPWSLHENIGFRSRRTFLRYAPLADIYTIAFFISFSGLSGILLQRRQLRYWHYFVAGLISRLRRVIFRGVIGPLPLRFTTLAKNIIDIFASLHAPQHASTMMIFAYTASSRYTDYKSATRALSVLFQWCLWFSFNDGLH